MSNLSRILAVLGMILAVIALVLSFLLFQRRTEFRDRADKLATAVSATVKALDKDSGSDLGKTVNFIAADKEAGRPEDGSLGWKKFQEDKGVDGQYTAFQDKLTKVKKLAEEVDAQRNVLADRLADVGVSLGLTDQDFSAGELKTVAGAKYADVVARITAQAAATKARDDAMIKAVVNLGTVIGKPIEEKAFRERQSTMDKDGNAAKGDFSFQPPLTELATSVTGLHTRATDYADTLIDAIDRVPKHQWATTKEKIKDEKEYAGAMTSLRNDFDDLNQKLAQFEETKVQLETRTRALKVTAEELDKTKVDLEKTLGSLQEAAARLKKCEATTGQNMNVGGDGKGRPIPPSLQGKVVHVNRDWKFVILDLGADKVNDGLQMLVARGDKLVAKVQISKVYPRFSIAEVLPEAQLGDVQDNDRVIMPNQQEK